MSCSEGDGRFDAAAADAAVPADSAVPANPAVRGDFAVADDSCNTSDGRPQGIAWRVTWLDETGSTNDEVRALAEQGAPEGACVAARMQRSGRGQWQRRWESPRGGLYFSFLLRPPIPESRWSELSPAIAGAVARTLRRLAGAGEDDIWVKAPNDVVCAQGKLCGNVLEAKDGCVTVGVGVNVFHPELPLATDGRNVPAFLEDFVGFRSASQPVSHGDFLELLLVELLSEISSTVAMAYRF